MACDVASDTPTPPHPHTHAYTTTHHQPMTPFNGSHPTGSMPMPDPLLTSCPCALACSRPQRLLRLVPRL